MPTTIETKTRDALQRLRGIMEEMESVLVAFSGGIDSTLVLKVAHDVLGSRAAAVTAVSPTVSASELSDCRRIVREIGAAHHVVTSRVMERPEFFQNGPRRCYSCKEELYSIGKHLAGELGFRWMANGAQLDDLKDFRPGLEAARDFQIRSPLAEAGLVKTEVRRISRALELPEWDKPADACLSSRVPFGTWITVERLGRIEQAEAILKREGFRQVRVRDHGEVARIELSPEDFNRLIEGPLREKVAAEIQKAGFRYITMDLQGYRQGNLNPEEAT